MLLSLAMMHKLLPTLKAFLAERRRDARVIALIAPLPALYTYICLCSALFCYIDGLLKKAQAGQGWTTEAPNFMTNKLYDTKQQINT